MRYQTIYIRRYNNGERNFKREITVFNEYETEELLGEEKTKEVFKIYQKQAFGEENSSYDITSFSIDIDNTQEELKKLQTEILEQAETVSGDDDVYDCFPDLVFAFEQICEKLNSFDIYNETLKTLDTMENTIADGNWTEQLY